MTVTTRDVERITIRAKAEIDALIACRAGACRQHRRRGVGAPPA